MSPQAYRVIREMRRLLLEHGWCQYSFHRREGSFCLAGAEGRALGNVGVEWRVASEVRDVLVEYIRRQPDQDGLYHVGPMLWNDSHGRTKDEVIALLDGVLAECDAPVEVLS